MDIDPKVISSDITRSPNRYQNNLYDLLDITPAKPVKITETIDATCCYSPKTDKHYIPKRKTRCNKVKTVRDIRQLLEKDIYSYLPSELEQQQAILLKKIRDGSSRDETTKLLVNNVLKTDKPISRAAWQMLININPEQNRYPKQYVLWNGKCIQVNGSKGGKNKFICNYDLAKKRLQKINLGHKKTINKRKGLLQHSLTVKFKPGPLGRKKYLDDSHQKYHVGDTELVNLPKPGLDIQPSYGFALDPIITNFLNNLRDENGTISHKWAEFAVTVLGSVQKSKAIQDNENGCVFDLKYKCGQNRILMRRDIDKTPDIVTIQGKNEKPLDFNDGNVIMPDIKFIMTKILDCVEISLEQDNMYTDEEEPRQTVYEDVTVNSIVHKDKSKRKYCELDRLDVTVIRLPEDNQRDQHQKCGKLHCSLGCICASINCPYTLKRHCGLVECMFECKCDFSKYRDIDSFHSDCTDLIPGLLNLNKEMNLKLAKEEQKFRQTVIVSGEKSVLLKSQKRNCKSSKKYSDFYSNFNIKSDIKTNKILTVVDVNLNCVNVEPWCMIHNLYKCFCKGRFTDTTINDGESNVNKTMETKEEPLISEAILGKKQDSNEHNTRRTRNLPRKNSDQLSDSSYSESSNTMDCLDSDKTNTSARVNAYQGRKYSDGYYKNTNGKILELEKDDEKLRKRMMGILGVCETKDKTNLQSPAGDKESFGLIDIINNITEERSTVSTQSENRCYNTPNKEKLVAWLETSYKLYKQRTDQGIIKTSLDPPKFGKLALYPWDFILSRYRERKNLFLISKQMPFRIFMAVDRKHAVFENCINIDDIRFAELHKYPTTVKNLLTNTADMKDNFCILCGLSHCWELIGSVTKVNEKKENSFKPEDIESDLESVTPTNEALTTNKILDQSHEIPTDSIIEKNITSENEATRHGSLNSESSKWFVMTVENDFSEIQFYKRGFFVKYESIVKAINVARMSGKTVRLSSQKCVDKSSGPQFGIYAIPNTKEYCVFVGPYEIHETLGIETVKTIIDIGKQTRTRGVWITTDKVDNLKVIDNPLSFLPSPNLEFSEIPLETDLKSTDANLIEQPQSGSDINNIKADEIKEISNTTTASKTGIKTIKPIKIRKTNGFYHFATGSILKKISLQKSNSHEYLTSTKLLLNSSVKCKTSQLPKSTYSLLKSFNDCDSTISPNSIVNEDDKNTLVSKKPVAEVAPQKKIAAFYSATNIAEVKKAEGGMFILKPEEINKKVLENQLTTEPKNPTESATTSTTASNDQEMNLDIEDFLATYEVCNAPKDNVYIISDDEEYSIFEDYKNVWIQCENIDNFGWIKGRRNAENLLSFEFPGFKPTDFYQEQEAFAKITQVLSRKIYVPKHLSMKWQVIESESELKNKDNMLQPKHLGADFVLTKQGLRHKLDLIKAKKSTIKTYCRRGTDLISEESEKLASTSIEKTSDIISGLREQSKKLENENDLLWNEAMSNKDKILKSLSEVSDGLRCEMTKTLEKIMSMTDKSIGDSNF